MMRGADGRGSRAPRASSIAARPEPAVARPQTEAETESEAEEPEPAALVGEIGRELAALFSLLGQGPELLDADAAKDRARISAKPDSQARAKQGANQLDASALLLRELQLGLLRYPRATQAAFRALVAEGRRFASEPAGAALEQRLLASPDFRRLRRIYESLTWHMLEDQGENVLPSNYLDALVQVVGLDHLEPFLAALHSVTKR